VERGTESFLIQPPGNVYGRFNISIHGIDPSMTQNSPTFGELWPTLEDRIGGRPVVAHNASFDMSVLRYELDHMDLCYPDMEYYCTLVLSRACWPGLYSHRLPDVASHCGIAFHHHDAAEDARACAEILLQVAREGVTANASSDSATGPRRPSEAGMRAQGSATSRSRQILRARKSLISR